MFEYITTSATQRNSLHLLDRNAVLSQELGDLWSCHSICVEHPEYDRVLSENDRLTTKKKQL